jgi:SAM-dependent methyltransferase
MDGSNLRNNSDVQSVAMRARAFAHERGASIPLTASGQTRRRWAELFAVAHENLSLVKLVRPTSTHCPYSPNYASAFEPGCGYGHLIELLAPRRARVLAADADAQTAACARTRLSRHVGVTVIQANVPVDWPEETFDIIVLAEFLYYLPHASIVILARNAARSLKSQGELSLATGVIRFPDPISQETLRTRNSINGAAWIGIITTKKRIS